jgi:hypothetical protein
MAAKIRKSATADLGKFGGVPVSLVHEDGTTSFQLGVGVVSLADVRGFIRDANEVLTAIGEATL